MQCNIYFGRYTKYFVWKSKWSLRNWEGNFWLVGVSLIGSKAIKWFELQFSVWPFVYLVSWSHFPCWSPGGGLEATVLLLYCIRANRDMSTYSTYIGISKFPLVSSIEAADRCLNTLNANNINWRYSAIFQPYVGIVKTLNVFELIVNNINCYFN